MEDLTGKQFGLYRIIEPLGAGGMASVYKAYQPSVDRYVALKVLPQHFAKDSQFIKRFEQEAKVLAKLQHPHILPVHDYGQSDNYTYIVMPLVEGGDLADLMQSKRLSISEIGRIMSQVGDALDYAHAQGILHRDVKPRNILVDQRGNCLLTDFGIAKLVEGAAEKLTVTGGIVGTPTYMSPEQGLGNTLDGRSDIYALGVILYEMMTGQVPFQAETPMAVMLMHLNDPLQPPRKFDMNFPEAIERVILKALAKEPKDRYATAGNMVQALQAAIQAAGAELAEQPTPTAPSAAVGAVPAASGGVDPLNGANQAHQASPAASQTANPLPKAGPNQTLIWGIAGVALVGLILLGVWLFGRPGGRDNINGDRGTTIEVVEPVKAPVTPDSPVEAPVDSADSTESNEGPVSQPVNTPVPDAPPPPPESSDSQQPPPEAFEACNGRQPKDVCEFNTPRGTVSGTCRPAQTQLACIPSDGRPPGPPGQNPPPPPPPPPPPTD